MAGLGIQPKTSASLVRCSTTGLCQSIKHELPQSLNYTILNEEALGDGLHGFLGWRGENINFRISVLSTFKV